MTKVKMILPTHGATERLIFYSVYVKSLTENINIHVREGTIVIVNNYLYNNLLERND